MNSALHVPGRLSILLAAGVLAVSCGGDIPNPEYDVPRGLPDASDVTVVPETFDTSVPEKDWEKPDEGECSIPEGEVPEYTNQLGCQADFEVMAQRPPSATIPGAMSLKTVVDQADSNALYFLNATTYPFHFDFCLKYLSGNGLPLVQPSAGEFTEEYFSPYRRFILGAVTYYENPGVWTYEIAPYDTASAEMIATAYDLIGNATFIDDALYFHPTSNNVEMVLPDLPEHVKVITNDELFAGITYLPLNLGIGIGQLRFILVDDLESGAVFVTPRDIVVLDRVPNDISVIAGLITQEYQTPLSHVNVLSQNRGTPNMSLKSAMDNEALRDLEGKWVRLEVEPFEYIVTEVSKEEADAWWEEHKPPPVQVPALDLEEKDLAACEDIGLDDIPRYGGKASHFGELTRLEGINVPDAFAVPVFYYKQFEQENGFDVVIDGLLADPQFQSDINYREQALKDLRKSMVDDGELNMDFFVAVMARLEEEYPGTAVRFRSSTNAEDLNGFTGAGLYTSKTFDPADPARPADAAIKKVFAALWNHRAFEERSYRGIDHKAVSMALLVHRSFPAEDANGVALTANIFSDAENAFYINVQKGDTSVVLPPAGVTTDSFLYFFTYPGQPMVFFSHSNLVEPGQTVLSKKQAFQLGEALQIVHAGFWDFYGSQDDNNDGKIDFYAMDVEFKFNTEAGDAEARLWIKQARPHPGWEVGLGN